MIDDRNMDEGANETQTPGPEAAAAPAAQPAGIGSTTIETPTAPGAPAARRHAGKAGAGQRGKTAAKKKPGVKVPKKKKGGAGEFKRETLKTSRAAGKKPSASQKKGPKKAASAKKAATSRKTSAGVTRGVTGGRKGPSTGRRAK